MAAGLCVGKEGHAQLGLVTPVASPAWSQAGAWGGEAGALTVAWMCTMVDERVDESPGWPGRRRLHAVCDWKGKLSFNSVITEGLG